MKKGFAVFFLHVMLLVAIQPVISLHFCKGELHSVDLMKANLSSCCEIPAKESQVLVDFDTLDQPYSNQNHNNSQLTDTECCDFEAIKFSTDNYQNQIQQPVSLKSLQLIQTLGVALINTLPRQGFFTETGFHAKIFPTTGILLQDVSLLTYICTYRI